MKETWRWFGPDDTVSLDNILQAGASGVVTALDHIETGQIWPIEDINERNTLIKSAGLEWSVVEQIVRLIFLVFAGVMIYLAVLFATGMRWSQFNR